MHVGHTAFESTEIRAKLKLINQARDIPGETVESNSQPKKDPAYLNYGVINMGIFRVIGPCFKLGRML